MEWKDLVRLCWKNLGVTFWANGNHPNGLRKRVVTSVGIVKKINPATVQKKMS